MNSTTYFAIIPKNTVVIGTVTEELHQIVSFKYQNKIQIILAYVSHVSRKEDLDSLLDSLKKIIQQSHHLIILGDFNFNANARNVITYHLKEVCKLHQMIDIPTQQEGGTIDHLYLSKDLEELVEIKIMFKYFSDHAAFQLKIKESM